MGVEFQKSIQNINIDRGVNDNELNKVTIYQLDNISFVVEPIFKKYSSDTLGLVLLRLMTT